MAEFMDLNWRRPEILLAEKPKIPATKEDRSISISALRNMIFRCDDEELKNNMKQDDVTMSKFLHTRKFDVLSSFQLVQNYYWYRKRNPDIFKNFSLESQDIQTAILNCLPGVLTSKDRKGRCVLLLTANNWDCSYDLLSIYRAFLLTLEYLTNDLHNQANGFVVIVDWTEFSFRKSTNLKPATLKLMIEGLQDCFPAKFKGIHFLGQPWYIEASLLVIKQFLKEKIKERIFVHGNNLSLLHEYVHKDILPAELGGEEPSYNPEVWLKMMQNEQYIL